ncbi:hypothetical protein BDW42DRAFT_178621 [Aspergillus taichungensis]|uniref:Uncharacterized protein n=1 Tax=Aspergillus taichungensis TaxID=482145 RepID=A0A2J5HHY6_9EURO|nr:hypothetical protein BDW42DRAFT_178621 [Aspergillus taichungensis]
MDESSNPKGLARLCVSRRSLGVCLLLIVVVLWTTSNFLASTIFADDTYSKPFFVTYIDTSMFILPFSVIIVRRLFGLWRAGKLHRINSFSSFLDLIDSQDTSSSGETQSIFSHGDSDRDPEMLDVGMSDPPLKEGESAKLGVRETARLSLQFCILWFLANYFALACLQYTTVGSTTILTSTSGVWTLIFGAMIRVEKFTLRKLAGVIASLIGIVLISRVDLSGPSTPSAGDGADGKFPTKSTGEIALGDAMAGFSAIMYGIYTVVLKKQVDDESRVNMPIFFGLVGIFNIAFLWPGFIILHIIGLEEFALPPTANITMIIIFNSLAALASDICWAYAMLLTTPLVVTVGLSLTIPLSLVGQIVLQGQYASAMYWVGAGIVFLSFLVVNHESKTTSEETSPAPSDSTTDQRYDAVPAHEDDQ